jgi:hypothetical protein
MTTRTRGAWCSPNSHTRGVGLYPRSGARSFESLSPWPLEFVFQSKRTSSRGGRDSTPSPLNYEKINDRSVPRSGPALDANAGPARVPNQCRPAVSTGGIIPGHQRARRNQCPALATRLHQSGAGPDQLPGLHESRLGLHQSVSRQHQLRSGGHQPLSRQYELPALADQSRRCGDQSAPDPLIPRTSPLQPVKLRAAAGGNARATFIGYDSAGVGFGTGPAANQCFKPQRNSCRVFVSGRSSAQN